jgi:hypothetical protein
VNEVKKEDSFKTFLIIWLGELISSIGSGMTAFGLGVHVWQLSRSAVDVSMVEIAALLPMILLCPSAGVLAGLGLIITALIVSKSKNIRKVETLKAAEGSLEAEHLYQ